ncbi:MAG: helix-turn-helix domain-containing protein [Bacteroidota bacterium]
MLLFYLVQLGSISLIAILLWFAFDFETWDHRVRYGTHALLSIYLVLTAITLRKPIHIFLGKTSSFENHLRIVVFIAVLLVCLGFIVSLKTTYILGPLVFSLVFYLTSTYLMLHKTNKPKSYLKKIDSQRFALTNNELQRVMEEDHLYRDSDLSLDLLASRLGVRKHFLSQMLNDNLKKTFHQYVNEYRIDEACRMLIQEQHFSIEAIGYEVGFSSRSAFFATFKKIKGTTPSKYRTKT